MLTGDRRFLMNLEGQSRSHVDCSLRIQFPGFIGSTNRENLVFQGGPHSKNLQVILDDLASTQNNVVDLQNTRTVTCRNVQIALLIYTVVTDAIDHLDSVRFRKGSTMNPTSRLSKASSQFSLLPLHQNNFSVRFDMGRRY